MFGLCYIPVGKYFLPKCLLSGSRGVGNRIGNYFIELAKKDMKVHVKNLPDKDLAYFQEGTQYFDDYVEGNRFEVELLISAVGWAQKFAKLNRKLMMDTFIGAVKKTLKRDFTLGEVAVNCHREHFVNEEN